MGSMRRMRTVIGCLLSFLLVLGFQAAPALAAPPYPPQVTLSGLTGQAFGSGVIAQPVSQPVREFGPLVSGGFARGASVTVPVVSGVAIEPRRVQEIVRTPTAVGGASVTVPLRSASGFGVTGTGPPAATVALTTAALATYAGREAAPAPVVVVPQPANANAGTVLIPVASAASATNAPAHSAAAPPVSASAQAPIATPAPVQSTPANVAQAAPVRAAAVAAASAPIHVAAPAAASAETPARRPGGVPAAIASPIAGSESAVPAASQDAAVPADMAASAISRPTLGEIEWQLSRSAPVARTVVSGSRPPAGSVRTAADLVLKTATKSPSMVGDIARRALVAAVEPATEELSRALAPAALEMTGEPALSVNAQAAVPATEPLPNNASAAGAGGHGGTAFAACVKLLILLGSLLFCVRIRAANSRRPLSLSYAPPVPPG